MKDRRNPGLAVTSGPKSTGRRRIYRPSPSASEGTADMPVSEVSPRACLQDRWATLPSSTSLRYLNITGLHGPFGYKTHF